MPATEISGDLRYLSVCDDIGLLSMPITKSAGDPRYLSVCVMTWGSYPCQQQRALETLATSVCVMTL